MSFLVLDESPTNNINGSVGALEQKFGINFSKEKVKIKSSFHYNGYNSYLFVNGNKSIKLKPIMKMLTFLLNVVLEAYLKNSEESQFRRSII